MKPVALLLLLTGLLARGQADWQNQYTLPLNFNCPAGQSISSITSEHSSRFKDRIWDFTCEADPSQTVECYWTDYVSDFNENLLFECPSQQVIAGMNSYYSNEFKDRRWKFYCCKSKFNSANCQWTPYVNSFDDNFSWTVPSKNVLVGTQSYHQNDQEDRRWKNKVCAQ